MDLFKSILSYSSILFFLFRKRGSGIRSLELFWLYGSILFNLIFLVHSTLFRMCGFGVWSLNIFWIYLILFYPILLYFFILFRMRGSGVWSLDLFWLYVSFYSILFYSFISVPDVWFRILEHGSVLAVSFYSILFDSFLFCSTF